MKAKVKAFGYLRTSVKGQIGNDGFPRQRDAIIAELRARIVVLEQLLAELSLRGIW